GNPYVPGSSLKGKLRSLLEWKQGKTDDRGDPCGCGRDDCMVCRVFGPHRNTRHGLGPSRIIVRDAALSAATKEAIDALTKQGKDFSETKTETMINRRTGIAATHSLRMQERLPSGAKFDLEISLRIFDGDDEKKMVDFVKEGLSMLEEDTLGGSGTRGYGWVKIENLKVTDA
ncbi:MAG: type III-A CRISPR-associated RAMP protein Csm3, partial [Chloroflexota bacterium]|nr:type III-A CRISPR-associated RAMP protein Csm3 [Chloroflexota bacterium]